MIDNRKMSLDILRFIGANMVIAHHSRVLDSLPLGVYGVCLFFALSGFLMCGRMIQMTATGKFEWKNYLIARTLRIWPVYFLTIALYILLYWTIGRHDPKRIRFFQDLPNLLTFTFDWFGAKDSALVHAWTISVEERFYLALPCLFILCQSQRARLIALLTCIIPLSIIAEGSPKDSFWALLADWADPILWTGVTGGIIFTLSTESKLKSSIDIPAVSLTGIALFSTLLVICLLNKAPPFIGGLTAVGLVCCAWMSEQNSSLKRILTTSKLARAVSYLGVCSYATYMIHGLVISFTVKLLKIDLGWTLFVIVLILSNFLGVLSWRYIEKPILAQKTHLSKLIERAMKRHNHLNKTKSMEDFDHP